MAVRRNISQKDLLAEDKKPLSERNAEEKQENAAEQTEFGEKKKKEKTHIIPVGDKMEYPENEDEHMMESNTFLDIVFDEDMEADFVVRPFEIKDEATGRIIRGNSYAVQSTDEDGKVYECAVKPYRKSDKALLDMLLG